GEVVAAARAAGRQSGGGGGRGLALGGRPGTAREGPADGTHAQALVHTRAVRAGIVAARVAIVAVGVARARGPGRQSGRGRGGRPALGGRPGTASEGPADGAHAQALVRTRAVRAGIAAAGVTVVAVGVARARGGVEALRAAEGAGQRAGLVRRAGDVRAGEADRVEALAAPHGGRALERAAPLGQAHGAAEAAPRQVSRPRCRADGRYDARGALWPERAAAAAALGGDGSR